MRVATARVAIRMVFLLLPEPHGACAGSRSESRPSSGSPRGSVECWGVPTIQQHSRRKVVPSALAIRRRVALMSRTNLSIKLLKTATLRVFSSLGRERVVVLIKKYFAAAIRKIKTNEQRTSNRGSSAMRFYPPVVSTSCPKRRNVRLGTEISTEIIFIFLISCHNYFLWSDERPSYKLGTKQPSKYHRRHCSLGVPR